MKPTLLVALSLSTYLCGTALAQSVPETFNQAETTTQSSVAPSINSLPSSVGYSILNYNASSGTRSTSTVSVNNTFGVSTEGSGTQSASSNSFARVGISDTCDNCNGVKNTIGGDNGTTRYETTTEYVGTLPGLQTAASDVKQTSTAITTITGVSSVGTLNMNGSGQANGSIFESTSSISETASGSSSSLDGASNADKTNNTASGGARGYLNTNMNVDTQQSSFTNIFLNAF